MINASDSRRTDLDRTAPLVRSRYCITAGDLLPVCDFAGVGMAGLLGLHAHTLWVAKIPMPGPQQLTLTTLIIVAAALAAFVLYDPRVSTSTRSDRARQIRTRYATRWLLLLTVVLVTAYATRWLEQAPPAWLLLWMSGSLLLSSACRAVLRLRGTQAAQPHGAQTMTSPPPHGCIGEGPHFRVLADRPIKRWGAVFKSAKDIILAALLTVLLLPLLAAVALAIRLDSPGPVLFRQRRHGFNNAEFDIYKFRTMRVQPASNDEPLQQTVRGDARITRVGAFLRKWSLDELPQVFNVLDGSMSLVGPRPHAVNMRTEQQLGHEIIAVYAHRHRVKPGITGWSQINGARGATDTAEQLRRRITLDLHYVDNWSLLFDLKILSRTFKEVLRTTNAY